MHGEFQRNTYISIHPIWRDHYEGPKCGRKFHAQPIFHGIRIFLEIKLDSKSLQIAHSAEEVEDISLHVGGNVLRRYDEHEVPDGLEKRGESRGKEMKTSGFIVGLDNKVLV